jgi:hypothetical protein
MSSTLPHASDARLRASLPAGSAGKCYLWERLEVVDEDAGVLITHSWYELTFGELPGRSVYAEQLVDSSLIKEKDVADAAALAAAWAKRHRSEDALVLRAEDQELAAQSRSATDYSQLDKQASSKYFVWDVHEDGSPHIVVASNERHEALRYAAEFYVAHTLYTDTEPSLYFSQSTQDVGERLPADLLLDEARNVQLSPALERGLAGLLAARPENQHTFQATGLKSERLAPGREAAGVSGDPQVLHAVGIHRELECRVSQDGKSNLVVSFFNPVGGMPTVVNPAYYGVKEAVREAVAWAERSGFNDRQRFASIAEATPENYDREELATSNERGRDEYRWWPVLREASDAAERDPLVGFVLESDANRAKEVACRTLDFGFGVERIRIDPEPEKFPGLSDSRYVMWTVDSEGVATNYTSDRKLANVADVATRYEAIANSIDASVAAPIISEWETSSEPPRAIRLPQVNEREEHLEFDLAQLGRQVSQGEVELARGGSERRIAESNIRSSDPHYIVWEERRDGTAVWRAYEMKLDGARERAVELAVEGRRDNGELSTIRITAWDPWQDLPERTVPAASVAVIGVPIAFDIHQEIRDRHPIRPQTVEQHEERYPESHGMTIVRVQSTLEVKPGDFVQVHVDKDGEQVGHHRGQGLGSDQLEAPPQFAVVQEGTNKVVSVHPLKEEAVWFLEPHVDAAYASLMRLGRQSLPPLPAEVEPVEPTPTERPPAKEMENETTRHLNTERVEATERSPSSQAQERTRSSGPDFEW